MRPAIDPLPAQERRHASRNEHDRVAAGGRFRCDSGPRRKLSFQEFCGWKHTPEQIAAAKKEFAEKDTDSDSFLVFKEYAFRQQDADFWKADRDGNNRLSLDEFKTSRPSDGPDGVDKLFDSIDQNRDGSISLGEFQTQPAGEQ